MLGLFTFNKIKLIAPRWLQYFFGSLYFQASCNFFYKTDVKVMMLLYLENWIECQITDRLLVKTDKRLNSLIKHVHATDSIPWSKGCKARLKKKQYRFSTCFKNPWNNPSKARLQKKKTRPVFNRSQDPVKICGILMLSLQSLLFQVLVFY